MKRGSISQQHYRPSAELKRCNMRSTLSSCRRSPCHIPFDPFLFNISSSFICLCNASKFTRGTVVGRPWAHCTFNILHTLDPTPTPQKKKKNKGKKYTEIRHNFENRLEKFFTHLETKRGLLQFVNNEGTF